MGLRSLTQAVPFVCTAENRPLAACQVLWAAGRLLLCEAQALTPRRLSLRLMPEWTVCGYTCTTVQLCCGVEEDPALRLRRREHELYMTAAMAEREGAVAGEVTVPAGQPAPEDLLLCRLYPQVTSCQLVGTKLLVKGELTLCALYRCQQQKLHTYTAVVPFSQIVDSPAGGEEGDVAARVQLICGEARLLRTEESSGFSVSAELLRQSAILARQYHVRLHTHLCETKDEEAYMLEREGMRPLAFMQTLGWVGPDVWYAHGIHFNDEELKLLAETGTGVCHCPASNMKLSSGIARIPDMLKLGVPVGLGVDGSASNDGSSLMEELRTAFLLHRLNSSREAPSGYDVLKIATRGSARLLGRSDIGSLAAGKCCDLFLIDSRRMELVGACYDPKSVLATVGVRGPVDYTVVNGKITVREGRLARIDEEATAREARMVCEKYLEQ